MGPGAFGGSLRGVAASVGAALVAALLGLSGSALAQPVDSSAVRAEQLFQEAKQLMESGQTQAACDRFAASQELQSAPGTLLNLGVCYAALGRTASAWRAYRDAEARAEELADALRQSVAQRYAREIEPRLTRLEVEVSERTAERRPRIEVDGRELAVDEWGVAFPVDPGVHRVQAWIEGDRVFGEVVRAETGTSRVRIDLPNPPPAEPARPVVAPVPVPRPSPPEVEEESSARHWPWAMAGGLGVAGLAVGIGFGVSARDKWDAAKAQCSEACGPRAPALSRRARKHGHASTAGFAIGGVGIAASVVLWSIDRPRTSKDAGGLRVGASARGVAAYYGAAF